MSFRLFASRHQRVLACIVFAVNALQFSAAAKCDVAYDNLAPGGGAVTSDKTFGSIAAWGQQFTANANGSFTNIKLNLYVTSLPQTQFPTFRIELWSDGGANPGARLATLKTTDWNNGVPFNNTPANTSAYLEVTTFDQNYSINSGTTYWLVVNQPDGNGPAAKRWTVNGSGLGQTASYNFTTGLWTNRGNTTNLGAQITVAVPEPGTLLLGSLAAMSGACGFYRKYRKRGTVACQKGLATALAAALN